MEKVIYLYGFKQSFGFNSICYNRNFFVSLEDLKRYTVAKPWGLLSGRGNCFLMTKT